MSWSGKSATQGVSRLGQADGSGNVNALFLKQFAGEVLTAFEEKNIAMPLHRVRTIKNGRSAVFPTTGTIGAAYHQAGTQIFGDTDPTKNEITVSVDDLLVSATFISNIEEAQLHYDVRSIYSKEMGNALANEADRNIFHKVYEAAVTDSGNDQNGYWTNAQFAAYSDSDGDVDGENGEAGKIDIKSTADEGAAASSITGSDIVSGIFSALQIFDESNVTEEKVCVLTPAAYYKLFNAGADANALAYMNKDVGGAGSMANANIPVIGGVKIFMSNHLPTADNSTQDPLANTAGSGNAGKYRGATSFNANLQGLIFTKDAVATTKLLDLAVESEYQIDRQGTLMVAKYAMGHDILRGKSSIALVA